MCASLSHTHYWYEVGMLKVPAVTGFLHLPSEVLAFIFLARRIRPFLFLVDGEVEFLCTNELIVLHLVGILFFIFYFSVRKDPSSCDCTEIRTHVPTSEGFEVVQSIDSDCAIFETDSKQPKVRSRCIQIFLKKPPISYIRWYCCI